MTFETKEMLRQLAGFVASCMSVPDAAPWRVDGSQHRQDHVGVFLIQAETGAEIFVRYAEKSPDRVEFTANYPVGTAKRVYPSPAKFRCTVDRYRHVDLIARDVMRKVACPAYFEELKRCRDSLAQDAANVDVRREIGNQLAWGYRPDRATVNAGGAGEKGIVDWSMQVTPRPHVTINHDGSKVFLRIEELTPGQAEAILKTLKLITTH